MNIVIAGDGELGFHLAKLLSKENHNITIVDPHQDLLEMLEAHSDLMTIVGDSTSISVLQNANAGKADLLISVLHDEQVNLLTAMIGKKLGAKKTIARVNSVEYLKDANSNYFQDLGVDYLVCPERIASKEIVRLLQQTIAAGIYDFSQQKLSIFLLKLDEKTKVIGKTLNQVAKENPNLNYRAVAIQRDYKTIIPNGNDEFLLGDLVYVISKNEGVDKLIDMMGKERITIKDVIIAGGGRIGRFAAKNLENDFNIKLIDHDKDRCVKVTDMLKKTLVICGDVRDMDLMEDEGIRGTDAYIAVTDDSETNILSCLSAKKMGVKKTIALVENTNYIDMADSMGIDTVLNKKSITAGHLVTYTSRSNLSSVKFLHGSEAEVLEYIVEEGCVVTKKPISKLKFPKEAIIGGIIRNEESYIAVGSFQIQAGDKVVVFSQPKAIKNISKYFI
jgi:trk/ktr system potassium uptake protein